MSFQDKTLECFDCSSAYTFSVEEQEEFQSRGYTNEPKRCPDCRQARKDRNGNSGNTYGNSHGNSSYGTPQRQLFPAVCADCGKETEVPFEPTQGRPVYCRDCYRKVSANR